MTLFCQPRRQMNMPSPGTKCFASVSSPYKIVHYVSSVPEKERMEPNRFSPKEQIDMNQISYSTYEELNFNLDDLSIDRSKSLPRSASSCQFAKIRSILKKSQSADAFDRRLIDVPYLRQALDDSSLVRERADSVNISSKNVTFADDKNQSLVEVRMFVPSLQGSDILSNSPDFKRSGFLNMRDESNKKLSVMVNADWKPDLTLCFKEPSLLPNFSEKVTDRLVSLERCGTRNRLITGLVLVKNIEFRKRVFIRYTIDKWKSFSDTESFYLSTVEEGNMDRFTFTLNLPMRSREIEFAICFKTSSQEFWDNNEDRNYKVEEMQSPQSAG